MSNEVKKKAAKKRKPTKLPEGITMKRTSRGINVTISENGRIIAVLRGYNNTANMHKGLRALNRILNDKFPYPKDDKSRHEVIDITPKPKKAAKKK